MMTLNRGMRTAMEGLLAMLLVAGLAQIAQGQNATPAQPKKPAAAPKAPAKKPPVRRVVRPRAQTAPTRDRIVEIQTALAREGFYLGTPSGKWDAATSLAMRNFQSAKGLTPTGKLGAQSLQRLGLGAETAGRGAPLPIDERPSLLNEAELNEPEPAEPPAN